MDGAHLADASFTVSWPIVSIAVDPWNSFVSATLPNSHHWMLIEKALGNAVLPSFIRTTISALPNVISPLNEMSNAATAARGCSTSSRLLMHISSRIHSKGVKNPLYDIGMAFTFASCTARAINSLLRAVTALRVVLLATKRTEFWSTERLQALLVTILHLLEYYLENLTFRLGDDGDILTQLATKKVVHLLTSVLGSSDAAFT
jgi:hypothetical protein